MNDLIKIDPKEIAIFAEEAGSLVFRPQAEEALDELIKTRDLLVNTVEEVLTKIKEAGEKVNPDFKGVKGAKYDLIKRQYGNKYTFKIAKTGSLGAFLKNKSYNYVNSEAVDKYLEELGELPEGVSYKDREYKMTLRRKDDPEES